MPGLLVLTLAIRRQQAEAQPRMANDCRLEVDDGPSRIYARPRKSRLEPKGIQGQ
jgi:hypothetical protein